MTGQWPGLTVDHGESLVLSVGTGGGITSGFDGLADGGGLVRLGVTVLSLSDSEYIVWDAGLRAPTPSALLRYAHEMGVSEPQSLLRELAEAGLVVEYTREASALKGHAHVLTARLTGRLIGNGPHGSAQFLIEPGSASPPLALDVVLYQFLLWADGRSPIALSCERVGTSGLPHECDAIYHVAEWLPALLRAGLISLDRVAAGEEVTLLCRVRYALR